MTDIPKATLERFRKWGEELNAFIVEMNEAEKERTAKENAMTDIPKELIEAVRSGPADEIVTEAERNHRENFGDTDLEYIIAQAIVAERETRPKNVAITGDVLSDTKIPCDCTPFSCMCRRRRRMCKSGIVVETKTLLQDVAVAVDQILDNSEETHE